MHLPKHQFNAPCELRPPVRRPLFPKGSLQPLLPQPPPASPRNGSLQHFHRHVLPLMNRTACKLSIYSKLKVLKLGSYWALCGFAWIHVAPDSTFVSAPAALGVPVRHTKIVQSLFSHLRISADFAE